jgi:hypothetical protein
MEAQVETGCDDDVFINQVSGLQHIVKNVGGTITGKGLFDKDVLACGCGIVKVYDMMCRRRSHDNGVGCVYNALSDIHRVIVGGIIVDDIMAKLGCICCMALPD